MSDWDENDVNPTMSGEQAPAGSVDDQVVEDIAEDVRADILHGHVEDDVSHVLEERLEEVGVTLPPEDIDELAEEIENDVST
jgi:hypothetical protein